MLNQPLTLEEFRKLFPEIDSDSYPDIAVKARLALAAKFFSEESWPDPEIRAHVMGLYTAHYLKLQGSAADGGNGDDNSGLGQVSSMSVDGASVSYDTSSSSEEGAGSWNLTAYGRELWQLIQLFGAGARQI